LINEILKTQIEDGEEETDADVDIRISLRNEFVRCGLTDGRVRKIKQEAESDLSYQQLLLKQCDDYINEREEDMVELQTRIKAIKEDLKETDDVYEFLKNSTSNTLGTGSIFLLERLIEHPILEHSFLESILSWNKLVNIFSQFFNTYYLSETMLLSEINIFG